MDEREASGPLESASEGASERDARKGRAGSDERPAGYGADVGVVAPDEAGEDGDASVPEPAEDALAKPKPSIAKSKSRVAKKPKVRKTAAEKSAESDDAVDDEESAPAVEPEPAPVLKKAAPKSTKRKKARRISRRSLVKGVVITAAVIVAIGIVAFLSYRWFFINDVERIQGRWVVDGTSNEITIDQNQIVLSPDLTFRYEIDPFAKTITFHFSELEGGGHYRFSMDGNRLAIHDGEYNAWDTLVSDAPFTLGALVEYALGNHSALFGDTSDVTNLTRVGAVEAGGAPGENGALAPGATETAPDAGGNAVDAGDQPEGSGSSAGAVDAGGGDAGAGAGASAGDGASDVGAAVTEEEKPAPRPMESLGQDPDSEAGSGAVGGDE